MESTITKPVKKRLHKTITKMERTFAVSAAECVDSCWYWCGGDKDITQRNLENIK